MIKDQVVYLPQPEQEQLEPQLQEEAPEQPQSPAIVKIVWWLEGSCLKKGVIVVDV